MARILEFMILNGSATLDQALSTVVGAPAEKAQAVMADKDKDHVEAARNFGVSCCKFRKMVMFYKSRITINQ